MKHQHKSPLRSALTLVSVSWIVLLCGRISASCAEFLEHFPVISPAVNSGV